MRARNWQVRFGLRGVATRGALAGIACLVLAAVVAYPVAHAKRQTVENEAHFHRVGPGGKEIQEKGTATGTFPGPATTRVVFNGNKMTGTFSLHTTGGTVVGKTDANIVGSSARPVVRFVGTATITGGTGRFRTASGTLKLNGTMRRINNAIYEKTTGRIHF
ncbi:MAG: hypothetical protein QOF85_2231 [Solirubrobacterales bacterium]|nr:hypothetical protein [Solirubrobacterales bacterium]